MAALFAENRFLKSFLNLERDIRPIVVIVIRQVLQLSLGIYILVF